jgi:hypothetical protein
MMSGSIGRVCVGNYVAYHLGRWSLELVPLMGPVQSRITARITRIDPFWSTQGPKAIWLCMGEHWWGWDYKTISCTSSQIVVHTRGDFQIARNSWEPGS